MDAAIIAAIITAITVVSIAIGSAVIRSLLSTVNRYNDLHTALLTLGSELRLELATLTTEFRHIGQRIDMLESRAIESWRVMAHRSLQSFTDANPISPEAAAIVREIVAASGDLTRFTPEELLTVVNALDHELDMRMVPAAKISDAKIAVSALNGHIAGRESTRKSQIFEAAKELQEHESQEETIVPI